MKFENLIKLLSLIVINLNFSNSCDISKDNTLVPNSGCTKYYICFDEVLEEITCVFL